MLYSYAAQDENDLSVDRGQCVTVLNSDDPDWYWVTRADHKEGFVPQGFIYPLDAIQRQRELPKLLVSRNHYFAVTKMAFLLRTTLQFAILPPFRKLNRINE